MSDTPRRRKSSRNRIPSLRLRESQESEQLQQSHQFHQSRPRGRGRGRGRGGRGVGGHGGCGGIVGDTDSVDVVEEEDDDQGGSQESADDDGAAAAVPTVVRGRPSYSAQLWRNNTETAADNHTDGFSTAPSSPTSPPAPLPSPDGPAAVPDGPAAAPDGPAAAPDSPAAAPEVPDEPQDQDPTTQPTQFPDPTGLPDLEEIFRTSKPTQSEEGSGQAE